MACEHVLWVNWKSDISMRNKISIIVPVYNRERYLDACLRSVKNQIYLNWECIVIDDGSEDNSILVASSYAKCDSRFRVFRQENRGPSAARNVGLEKSTGEWVLFLDSDDALEKEALECRITAAMGAGDLHGSLCVIYGSERYYGGDLSVLLTVGHYRDVLSNKSVLLSLLRCNVFAVNSLLISRLAMVREGGFDESLDRAEDWDMWLRLALSGAQFIFADTGSWHGAAIKRVHERGLSSDKLLMIEAEIKVREKMKKLLPRDAVRCQNENDSRAFHRATRVAIYNFFSRDYPGAKKRVMDVILQKGVAWVAYSLIGNLFGMVVKREFSFMKKSCR